MDFRGLCVRWAYLDYQIADSKLDTNLNIYYPKTFDIQGINH